MDAQLKKLQKEKEELIRQLEQSQTLYRDKCNENEAIKLLLQKIV